MSRSRWSQWVIAESATARIPLPWDRKTRIRNHAKTRVFAKTGVQGATSMTGATT